MKGKFFLGLIFVFCLGGCHRVPVEDAVLCLEDASLFVDYNISLAKDIRSEEFIEYSEALRFIDAISNPFEHYDQLENWYTQKAFAPFDEKFSEEEKSLICDLIWSRTSLLSIQDLAEIEMSDKLCLKNLIKYGVLLTADSFGCMNFSEEETYTKPDDFYQQAFRKGLIKSAFVQNPEQKVSKKKFYGFMALIFSYPYDYGHEGGSSTTSYREIFELSLSLKESKPEKNKIFPLEAEPYFNDNLEFFPGLKDAEFFSGAFGYFCDFSASDPDESPDLGWSFNLKSSEPRSCSQKDMINVLLDSKENNVDKVYIHIYKEGISYNSKAFDIPAFKIIEDLPEMKPGFYFHKENQWPAEKITLREGFFVPGSYYILDSKSHKARNDAYNEKCRKLFYYSGKEASAEFEDSNELYYGDYVNLDEIHIRQLKLEGNLKDGFVIHLSPVSEGIFETRIVE